MRKVYRSALRVCQQFHLEAALLDAQLNPFCRQLFEPLVVADLAPNVA
jgi:hypothetical protein